MRIEDAQIKAERGREFLVESHAQLASDLTTLTADVIDIAKDLGVNATHADEMIQAIKETNQSVSALVRLFEDHARDGHGGKQMTGRRLSPVAIWTSISLIIAGLFLIIFD